MSSQTPIVVTGFAAAVSVVSLVALQSDAVSRRILTPERLAAKRRQEYNYKWSKALEAGVLAQRAAHAGGFSTYNADAEIYQTTLVVSESKVEELLTQLVTHELTVRPARVGKDERIENEEYYLWLYDTASPKIYQVHLTSFCTALTAFLQERISKTVLLFVADASSMLASDMVVGLIEAVCPKEVGVVPQPLWMAQVAALLESRLFSRETCESIFFALARLEAIPFEKKTGTTTVLISLPGQSVSAILLSLAQAAFPDDRILFGYTRCSRAIQAAALAQKSFRLEVPKNLTESVQLKNPVTSTTPLLAGLSKSSQVMPKFPAALSALPLAQASVTETWMTAVHAYLSLKEDGKEFLPFCLQWDYLATAPHWQSESDAYWGLHALLQFCTGRRSRPLDKDWMDRAVAYMQDYVQGVTPRTVSSVTPPSAELQQAVFQHKGILIEHKTLLDTVQPTQHWSLKDTAKRGCSCCAPEEEEEEDQATAGTRTAAPMTAGYVDGKTTFAFDPTRFG